MALFLTRESLGSDSIWGVLNFFKQFTCVITPFHNVHCFNSQLISVKNDKTIKQRGKTTVPGVHMYHYRHLDKTYFNSNGPIYFKADFVYPVVYSGMNSSRMGYTVDKLTLLCAVVCIRDIVRQFLD